MLLSAPRSTRTDTRLPYTTLFRSAGAIVKGVLFLEQLEQVNTVVLDNTGTLTLGRPELRVLIPVAGVDETALLDAAASAELRSEHPLGKTIDRKSTRLNSSH